MRRAVVVVMALALVACVHETPAAREQRVRTGTSTACHLIGDLLTLRDTPPTGSAQGRSDREQALDDRLRSTVGAVTAGNSPEHDAIAAYIRYETRRKSQEELETDAEADENGRGDPDIATRFQAMLAGCDALVPDANLTALNARLVEDLKRRYGP